MAAFRCLRPIMRGCCSGTCWCTIWQVQPPRLPLCWVPGATLPLRQRLRRDMQVREAAVGPSHAEQSCERLQQASRHEGGLSVRGLSECTAAGHRQRMGVQSARGRGGRRDS